jgi:uncharacterized protein YkwD
LSARVTGSLTRRRLLLRAFLSARIGRLLLAGLVTAAITGLVLAVPVIAGSSRGSPSVVLDQSSTTTPELGGGSPPGPASQAPAVEPTAPGTTGAGPAPAVPADPPADRPTSGRTPAGAPAPSSSSSWSSSSSSSSSSIRPTSPPSTGSVPSPSVPGTPAPDAAPPPAVPAELDAAAGLIDALDQARAAAGCDPLAGDAELAAVAQAHSEAMRDGEFFGLLGPDGQSLPGTGARAAAISRGTPSGPDVVGEWLTDSADAAAIGDCTLGSAGIGRAEGDGGPWWTLLLA